MNSNIISFTGHRPNKLGGYSQEIKDKLRSFLKLKLEELKPIKTISGMALGLDMGGAWASVDLNIPFIAAIPFKNQDSVWPESSKKEYRELLNLACERVIVCEGEYSAYKMQLRNEWMCHNADLILALWDGSIGGTGNCVKFAESINKPITNVWEEWIKYNV